MLKISKSILDPSFQKLLKINEQHFRLLRPLRKNVGKYKLNAYKNTLVYYLQDLNNDLLSIISFTVTPKEEDYLDVLLETVETNDLHRNEGCMEILFKNFLLELERLAISYEVNSRFIISAYCPFSESIGFYKKMGFTRKEGLWFEYKVLGEK
jgi:hypothetical protein